MNSLNTSAPATDINGRQTWYRVVGGAALWTLGQQGSYFACAWWVSWWAGAERFGVFSQGLALVAMLSAAITLRLEYAGQLERRLRRAVALFWLAERMALAWSAVLLLALAAARQWVEVPFWLWAGVLALLPQAGVLVQASQMARRMQVVGASALRAAPALAMMVMLALAKGMHWDGSIEWSIPLSAWICWIGVRIFGVAGRSRAMRRARAAQVAGFHAPFVRAELPGFLLNVAANHGQVLLVGWLGGDAAAGIAALALRIAMLPTSVFGLALADRLRARVVTIGLTVGLRPVIHQALRRMMALSFAVHAGAALAVRFLLPLVFQVYDQTLVTMVMTLLPLGAVRLVASPLAFVLPWRGWLGLSLVGQCLLFACALLSVLWGFPAGGLTGVSVAYSVSAVFVYLGYVVTVLTAVRVAA